MYLNITALTLNNIFDSIKHHTKKSGLKSSYVTIKIILILRGYYMIRKSIYLKLFLTSNSSFFHILYTLSFFISLTVKKKIGVNNFFFGCIYPVYMIFFHNFIVTNSFRDTVFNFFMLMKENLAAIFTSTPFLVLSLIMILAYWNPLIYSKLLKKRKLNCEVLWPCRCPNPNGYYPIHTLLTFD